MFIPRKPAMAKKTTKQLEIILYEYINNYDEYGTLSAVNEEYYMV